MDLEASRSKQRAAQQQAQTQPDGVARIGDRDPLTGRYTVQSPDGGIVANGIKTYTAASNPGDVVVLFPRADGSIAIDSEKGNPTIVPDVFNKPVPDAKKGGVWIFYRSAGKLWIGGHQTEPEEIGSSVMIEDDYKKGRPHVWGDKSGWVATFQVTEPFPINQSTPTVTFYSFTNNKSTTDQISITKTLGKDSLINYDSSNFGQNPTHSAFPLGAGFVAFRSRIDRPITVVLSGGTPIGTRTYSGSASVSIGYVKSGISTAENFQMEYTQIDSLNNAISDLTPDVYRSQSSFNGTIQIPNLGVCQYKGIFSSTTTYAQPGLTLPNGSSRYSEYSIQSIAIYAIMCDRNATYYIRETISLLSASEITPNTQRRYELFSSTSAQVLAANNVEPRFFGIRWDLRTFEIRGDLRPTDNASLVSSFYNNPAYYYQFGMAPGFGSTSSALSFLGSFPVGYYRRSRVRPINAPALIPVYDYDNGTPVTYSGGSVVFIPSTEIFKATIGEGFLVRKTVAINGAESTITSAYCHAIPADAVILHWSTTTV